jgi:hypothetical protein
MHATPRRPYIGRKTRDFNCLVRLDAGGACRAESPLPSVLGKPLDPVAAFGEN